MNYNIFDVMNIKKNHIMNSKMFINKLKLSMLNNYIYIFITSIMEAIVL